MTDDLQQERTRLASRMREQLWRYYPQMLELADDFAADWFLDWWSQAPTPAKAARLRETTIERFVKAHRLRRWQAPEVLRILKQKPLSVAPGDGRGGERPYPHADRPHQVGQSAAESS